MIAERVLSWMLVGGVVGFAGLMICFSMTRYTKPVGYDDDQPFPHPPLGHYGPGELDTIYEGWHIFADGNMWCAVGPDFENLQESEAGFGYTHAEAYQDLMHRIRCNTNLPDLVNAPQLSDFVIHIPTVKA